MSTKKCKVGGQAVMEGVMMKSPVGIAMAVRTEDGTIVTEYHESTSKAKKKTFFGLPIVRGVVVFVESLSTGMKTLTQSAELYGEPLEEAEPSRFEKWLSKKFGKSIEDVVIAIAVVLSLALSIGLFVVLPVTLGNLIFKDSETVWRSLLEGGLRLLVFIGYLLLCTCLKDVRRVFMYHGAEHKTISCYEADDELTPENAMKHTRLHPRCGTNYMFLVMAVSILIFTLIDVIIPFEPSIAILRILYRVGLRLVFLPLVAGVSYEVLQLAAKSDNIFAKIVRAPGMGLQLLTTREPTPDMIEVALCSFRLAMQSIGEETGEIELSSRCVTYEEYKREKESKEAGSKDTESDGSNAETAEVEPVEASENSETGINSAESAESNEEQAFKAESTDSAESDKTNGAETESIES